MVIKKSNRHDKKDWKYCLEATQLLKINQQKINQLEKNKLDIDGLNITVTGKI